jgi:hypothetical protein
MAKAKSKGNGINVQTKWSNGAFVFVRAQGIKPYDPQDVRDMATALDIDEAIVPDYAGDRATVARAINGCNSGLSRSGWLVRSIKRSHTHVLYGIVREDKNQAEETLAHNFESTLEWKKEPTGDSIEGEHFVAKKIDAEYQRLRGKIIPADWTKSLTEYLTNDCSATAMRDDGRVYWVPPQTLDKVRALGEFLKGIGIYVVCCEIESESVEVVKEAAQESLTDKLESLQAEVDAFDGKQKPSTYSKRIEEAQRLKKQAVLYNAALGVAVDKTVGILDALEQHTEKLLDIRESCTIARNGDIIYK